MDTDRHFMRLALEQAQLAAERGEVPVGAVLVKNDEILASGHNKVISQHDSSCHAEIDVMRQAGQRLSNYRLVNTTLYVTLEPCSMCVGAIVHARIERLVFGAYDSKTGAVCSAIKLLDAEHHNHKVIWEGGLLEAECGKLLQQFFREKRKKTA